MNSVSANLLAVCVAAMLCAGEQAAAQFAAPATVPVPQSQVPETWLMLKNGSTFSARMLSAGERVRLRVNEGDIEVRASEIALTGYSLNDLAEQQWATLHQQQLDKQLPFIDWCTRHHLYDIADAALAQMAAKAQDPPRVAGYQTRVKRLREIHQEQLAFQAAPAATPAPAPVVSHSAGAAAGVTPQAPLPIAATPTPTAATATLLLPAAPLTPASALSTAGDPATANQSAGISTSSVQSAVYQPLDIPREQSSAVKEPAINSPHPATLPSAAVEVFTARVQPWVVSRCSGCHELQSQLSFKLERYSKQEGVTRATTLKNLAAVTRLVDMDNPSESPLLVMAARAHGTSLLPPITAGDAAALAAFREFVGLATGREMPKPAKPSANSTGSLQDQPGHVTPGRATFPASAVEGTTTEDKAAAVLKQTGPGWQAAIERQKAIDAEAQRLRELQNNSQQVNASRGLIKDPAIKPATTIEQSAAVPASATVTPAIAPNSASTTAAPSMQLPPSLLTPGPSNGMTSGPSLLLEPTAPVASPLTNLPPATAPASSGAKEPLASLPQLNTLPPSPLPESLLPKSLAAKPKVDPELEAALEQPPQQPEGIAAPAASGLTSTTNLGSASTALTKPAPPINLNRPRKKFPLPPEDTSPSKGVGTGETKRR
jgi:hypothetical protein